MKQKEGIQEPEVPEFGRRAEAPGVSDRNMKLSHHHGPSTIHFCGQTHGSLYAEAKLRDLKME